MGSIIYLCGLLFGDLPIVQQNLKLLIVAIILISILPAIIEIWCYRRASIKEKQVVKPKNR